MTVDAVPGEGEVPEKGRGSRTRGIVVAVLVGGLLIAVLGASLKVKGTNPLGQDPSGRVAPDFTLPLLRGGGSITLSELRGRPVFLNFWASWCGPCKEEAPVLAAAWKEWESKGVIFLGVDAQDSKKWAVEFEDRYGIEYQSVVDGTQEVMSRYGVLGFPESFFIDADGNILAKYVGPIDAETLDAYLSQIAGG